MCCSVYIKHLHNVSQSTYLIWLFNNNTKLCLIKHKQKQHNFKMVICSFFCTYCTPSIWTFQCPILHITASRIPHKQNESQHQFYPICLDSVPYLNLPDTGTFSTMNGTWSWIPLRYQTKTAQLKSQAKCFLFQVKLVQLLFSKNYNL